MFSKFGKVWEIQIGFETLSPQPHEFHAQPLPNLQQVQDLGNKRPKPVTKPEPFHLESMERSQQKLEEFERRVAEERKEQEALAVFKARPNTVVYKEPFIPKRADKPLTGKTRTPISIFEFMDFFGYLPANQECCVNETDLEKVE